jgi:RHS repeat-associated protein
LNRFSEADPVDAVLSDIAGATTGRYLPGISEQTNGSSTYFHEGIKNAITQTNASQSMTGAKRYDAFGLQVSSTGTWKSPFAYGGPWGYQEDGDAYGLKLLGHRYYDPSLGRFLSRDIAKSGRNWSAFCDGDAVGRSDPSGLMSLNSPAGIEALAMMEEALGGLSEAGSIEAMRDWLRKLIFGFIGALLVTVGIHCDPTVTVYRVHGPDGADGKHWSFVDPSADPD